MKINQFYRFLSTLVFIAALCFAANAFSDDVPDSELDAQATDGFNLSKPLVSQMNNSGAATHQIPINIPPGRAGVQPKLVLQYNNYKGNGWIGMGWQIPFSYIQRNTRYGVNYDSFAFQIDGQELVPVNINLQGNGEYKAKIEGQFARFFYNRDTGWVMISKSGVKSYFGESHESRQTARDTSRVFKWCIDKVVDPNLNYMTYEYERDVGLGQIYLKRIDYTGNNGESMPPKNSIRFRLEHNRSDQSEIYSPHFQVVTRKRLKFIEVRALDNLVCAYELKYREDPATKQSLLESVQQYGSDSSRDTNGDIIPGSTMPQSKFTWVNGENRFAEPELFLEDFCWDTGWDPSQPRMMADVDGDGKLDVVGFGDGGVEVSFFAGDHFENPQLLINDFHLDNRWYNHRHPRITADVDGDGKVDVVGFGNSGVLVSFSLGRTFTDPQLLINNFGYAEHGGKWHPAFHPRMMADVNGDGKADVVGFGDDGVVVSFSLGRSFTSPQQLSDEFGYHDGWRTDKYPRTMADVNGDGKADVVGFGGDGVYVSISTGDHFEDSRRIVRGYGFGDGIGPDNWYVEYNPRMMADVNGDGMSDIVGFGDDGVYVSISTGSGFTPLPEEPWLAEFGWITTRRWTGQVRLIADVNGDSKSDIVGLGDDGVMVALSTGNGFSPPEIWIRNYGENVGGWRRSKHIRTMADVDGDGLSDLVGFGDASVVVSKSLCARGHLVEKVETPFGATIEFEYANSSEYESNPSYRTAPFISHPVKKLKVDDGNGTVAETSYNYYGEYYDFPSREYRGFEKISETKPNGTTTTYFYHLMGNKKDKIYRTDVRETAAEDSNLIRKVAYDWRERTEGKNNSFFVFLHSKLDILYEGGKKIADSIENFKGYDAVGNLMESQVRHSDLNNSFERIIKKYNYDNFGSDSEPMWRATMESLEGETSGLMRQTNYRYTNDGHANIEEKELVNNEGVNPIFKYQYDGFGNVTSETDARGNTTETTYDALTQTYPHTITYPQTSGVDHIEINETYDYYVGKPTKFKDKNDQYTYTKYDKFGRLEQTDLPDGGQIINIYDDHSFPQSMTERIKEKEGSYIETVTYFDGLDRKIQTASYGEAQKSIITKWQYDTMGRQEKVLGPFFGDGTLNYHQPLPIEYYFEHTTYDLRNRPLQIESPDGQNGPAITEYIHDGFSTKIIDPDGYSKTETKDCLGRIVAVAEHFTEAPDSTTRYEYNVVDELVRVENALGNVITIVNDTLGRKISMTDPDIGHWSYTYDPNGNLKTQTDAELEIITFEYDELNRIALKTYSSGDPSVKYAYDDPEVDNSIGRLTSVSNKAATIEYLAYDPTGRIVEERKTISGEGEFTTRKAYDLSGKLTHHTFPGDRYAIEYHYYPGSNLLEKVIGANDSHEYVNCSDYSPKGKMGALVHGNGVQTSHIYDPHSSRLIDIYTTHNNNALLGRSYLYKPSGDIEEITDTVNNITYTYTYDERHRLKSETSSESSPSFTPAVIELSYDDPDHIHAVSEVIVSGVKKSYSYDSNGNMTVGPDLTDPTHPTDRSVYYNTDNMPYEIRNSDRKITTFAYDGDNKRVIKQSPGGKKTLYIDDNYEVIDGVAHKYIFAGNLRVAMIKGSETYYFHKDHLGSSSVITRQNGSDNEQSQYLPYGGLRGTNEINATDYKFTDQEHDRSTGLYNYDARLYDPVIGRFVSADSVVPNWYDPQQLSRYAYVQNNPLTYVDPSGHVAELILVMGITAWVYDAIMSPSPANNPTSVNDHTYDSVGSFETVGNMFAGTTIGAAFAAGGTRAFIREVVNEVVDEATGGVTDVAKIGKNLPDALKTTGPLKNASGSLDDAARAARAQPHGPNTGIKRRMPRSEQDKIALENAKKGMGRNLQINLKDPRYKGMEKWHYSYGPKGKKSVVHYIKDRKTGELRDFKFK